MTMLFDMRPEREIRILLADRAGPSHAALTSMLAGLPSAVLVADLDDAVSLVPAVRDTHPDVVIIDDRLLRNERWTAADLGTRVIVIGMDDDPGFRARARRIGADAWVAKDRADAVLPALLPAQPAVTRPG